MDAQLPLRQEGQGAGVLVVDEAALPLGVLLELRCQVRFLLCVC